MKIVLTVLPGAVKAYPGPDGQGKTFIFTENFELVSIDGATQPAHTLGGSHSGTATVVREVEANDPLFPNNEVAAQYEATYLFATFANLPAAVRGGQLTAHGVFGVPKPATVTFAVTGGTTPFKLVRGEVTESGTEGRTRTFDITL